MSNNKVVPLGPFKGTAIPVEETRAQADGDGVWWHPRDRTPVVLDRFPLDRGFSITIEREASTLTMPQKSPQGEFYVDAALRVMQFPTVYITATLRGADKAPLAQATTLAILDGPRAYEQGENNARNRLYEAIGLNGAHCLEDFGNNAVAHKATASGAVPPPPTIAAALAAADAAPSAPPVLAAVTVSPTSPMATVKAVPSTAKKPPKAAAPVAPVAPVGTPEAADAGASETTSEISPSLLATAQQKAAMAGLDCPVFATEDEVLAFLDDLAA